MAASDSGAPPRISVVIPAYNRARLVGQAIESILAQSFGDLELLVVDDGSTDATAAVVRGFADPRLRLIAHERNRGMAAARNTGLDAARGEYVANLDSDDRAHPRRLERQIAFLDAHPDHAVVGSWITYIEEDGRPTNIIKRRPVDAADVHVQLLFGGGMTAPTMTGRTEVLRAYRYDESFVVRQDYDMLVRVAESWRVANLPETLHFHRRHADQVTRTKVERLAAATKQVIGHQLDRLGVPFAAGDLDRHYVLPRLGNAKLERQGTALRPDRAFLDWAEAWLRGIGEANARAAIYDPAALGHMTGWLWARTVWQVSRAEGFSAIQSLWRSPLGRLVPPALTVRLKRNIAAPAA